ncbi:type I DNA topoisomerase [uncultured Helicobacter sp.]|uniref:type I DNA topoisomerase n=1 Tax=uncultured Helicobacter sp. TaxID=175537 RepID=UPI0037506B7F
MKNLIIVESPAKARTIKNFLGKDYEVIASKGHIRDLPKYTLGIEVKDKHFIPKYMVDKDHAKIVEEIQKLAKKAKTTYIATDEDREGEAIGYHITQTLGLPSEDFPRIVFHEITQSAIQNALKSPRTIDMDKVNAQQARRLLDRIVGFKLSNLISSKIARGLSAGRVQSAALKIVIDREREIQAFESITYYLISAKFVSSSSEIESELISYGGKALQKLSLQDKDEVSAMLDFLKTQSYTIAQINTKRKKTSTPPPFMTSTLQQSASTRLGLSPTRTMSIAQRLYEGVQTHSGVMGVITYMRTDSLNIAKEASSAARALLAKVYGKEYVPPKPKVYTAKSKAAQEAHEAIRPTNLDFTPEIAKAYLKPEEHKLYKLIYERFLASQSTDAEFELQNIIFESSDTKAQFKANGRKLIFDGFYKIIGYEESDTLLPVLQEGSGATLVDLQSHQKHTEPPARYSEASLIKTLESLGIGRPSTYAPTIALLCSRDYLKNEKKTLIPQENALKVTQMLEEGFNEIVDSSFSASLEDKLDSIAQQKADWNAVLWEFYEPFMQKIEEGKQNIASQKIAIPTGEMCPKCGKELVKRNGKFGEFIACSGYPKCKYIKPDENAKDELSGEVCEKCGKPMVKKFGKNGEFIACSGYPECKNTKSLKNKPQEKLELPCPECGGEMLKRFSRRGAFYGCGNYPKCTFLSKYPLVASKCPKCGGAMCERELRKKHIYECLKCKEKIEQD